MRSEVLTVTTGERPAVHDLTDECRRFLAPAGTGDGLLSVWVPHATAGLAVMETGSGSEEDLLRALDELLPPDPRWAHHHGAAGHGRDHLLPAFVSPSLVVPVLGGQMQLGIWQSICLVDTNRDNRHRQVRLSFLQG